MQYSYPFHSMETRVKRREPCNLATRLFSFATSYMLASARSDDHRLSRARDGSFTCYGLLANLEFSVSRKTQNSVSQKKSPDLYFLFVPQPQPLTFLARSYPTRRVNSLLIGGKFLKKLWCCVGGEYYKII